MKRKFGPKQKFGKYFLKRLGISILASGALCAWYGNYLREDYRRIRLDDFLARYESTPEERLNRADEKGFLPELLSRMTTAEYTMSSIEYAIALYQPETGELIVSEPQAAVTVWQNGESQCYTLNDQAMIDRLADSVNPYSGESVRLYSIYIKDGQFLPGELYVQKKQCFPMRKIGEPGGKIAGEWVDLSPENTDGWTKVCSDYSKESFSVYYDADQVQKSAEELSADGRLHFDSVVITGSPNAPHADALLEMLRSEIPERRANAEEYYQKRKKDYENGRFDANDMKLLGAENEEEISERIEQKYESDLKMIPQKIYQHYRYSDDMQGMVCEEDIEKVIFRGKPWKLLHFQCVDPNQMFFRYFLIYLPYLAAVVLLITVLLALLWTVISYSFYSRHYDIEAYRRNLTGALAHDLKTPLSVIYGNAENLRAHTHPENADEYAECIMETVQHMDTMLASVLDLAALESRTAPEMKETVDLTALLHTAFERNAALMQARGLKLKESGKFEIKGNPELLRQLAENLAANAAQHSAEGGTVVVTAEQHFLRISNPYTGELDEKTLCEPFRRGDAARGTQAGSGLGLSIVQQIAALHRFRLCVTARNGEFSAELKKTNGFGK